MKKGREPEQIRGVSSGVSTRIFEAFAVGVRQLQCGGILYKNMTNHLKTGSLAPMTFWQTSLVHRSNEIPTLSKPRVVYFFLYHRA